MKRDMDYIRDLLIRLENISGDDEYEYIDTLYFKIMDVKISQSAPSQQAEIDLDFDIFNTNLDSIYNNNHYEPKQIDLKRNKFEYHLKLLQDRNLILVVGSSFHGLSWDGNDFLDAVRDDEIWKKTKEYANGVKSFSFSLLRDFAVGIAKKKFEDLSGIKV